MSKLNSPKYSCAMNSWTSKIKVQVTVCVQIITLVFGLDLSTFLPTLKSTYLIQIKMLKFFSSSKIIQSKLTFTPPESAPSGQFWGIYALIEGVRVKNRSLSSHECGHNYSEYANDLQSQISSPQLQQVSSILLSYHICVCNLEKTTFKGVLYQSIIIKIIHKYQVKS